MENGQENELMARAVWLWFIGGYTQEQIARQLGISRIKVNRLITRARQENIVRVFIDGEFSEIIGLENTIRERYGLASCLISPSLGEGREIEAAGNAGAKFIYETIIGGLVNTIGLGNGRTISAAVSALPKINNAKKIRFVSLSGSLMRTASANPFDMIYKICEKVNGEGYFMPAPFFSDSEKDREVIMAQKTMRTVLKIAREAEVRLVGLGTMHDNSFMLQSGLITCKEGDELRKENAVAEMLGIFMDRNGKIIDSEINRRLLGLSKNDLKEHGNYIIAGGANKAEALRAALDSNLITGIIVDETLAKALIKK